MKVFVLIMAVFLLAASAFAESGTMDCRAGRCNEVTGTYETENGKTRFMFLNNTDHPLFNIQAVIITYDFFDKPLRRTPVNFKTPMPAGEGLFTMGTLQRDVSKIGFELYAADDLK